MLAPGLVIGVVSASNVGLDDEIATSPTSNNLLEEEI
jgi:hypothetical protein